MRKFTLLALVVVTTAGGFSALAKVGPAPKTPVDVASAIRNSGDLGLFAGVLRDADVNAILQRDQGWTLFVPSDSALRNEGSAFLLEDVLRTPANAGRLLDLAQSHVVRGTLEARDLEDRVHVPTLAGARLSIERVGDGLRVGGHAMVVDRIETANGMIYVVDRLLWPLG